MATPSDRDPEDARRWNRWRRDTFGDPYLVWHEGPDFGELLRSCRGDPDRVERVDRMLVTGLTLGDDLAAEAVTALARAGLPVPVSEAVLAEVAPEASGTFAVRVAQALHTLTGDASWARLIVAVLAGEGHWGHRIDAAAALAGFPPAAPAVEALVRAVSDPEYLVRFHAAETLLRYAGDRRSITSHPLFAKIASPRSGRVTDGDRAAWREAGEELVALLAG